MLEEIIARVNVTDRDKYCPGWSNDKCDCRSGGVDQGYHNYLYHTGRFGAGATSFANGAGPVYTAGYVCDNPNGVNFDAMTLNNKGMVIQKGPENKGELARVVHQYDRCNKPKGWG